MTDQNEDSNFNTYLEKDLELQELETYQNLSDTSDVPSSSAGANEEPKAITNICYDCLERILDFLDFENLFNVARTCKRLQLAAAAKFGDDYGKKSFKLSLVGNGIVTRSNIVYGIFGLKWVLPFLRCFGAKISDLLLDIGYNNDEVHLHQYMNQYCANTLSHITFRGNWKFLNQDFPMSFVNVIEVQFIGFSSIYNNLPKISKHFPNIRHLTIDNAFGSASLSIIKRHHHFTPLPHLEHLILEGVTTKDATNFLHANPQLQCLIFKPALTIKFDQVVKMLAGNSSISKLDITGTLTDMNKANLKRFTIQCPMIEELSVSHHFSSDQALILVNQLSSLKRFAFWMNDHSEYDRKKLIARLDDTWKHSFQTENRVVAYILERE